MRKEGEPAQHLNGKGRREDFGRPFRSPLPSPASTFAPVVKEEEERAVAQECVAVWAAKEEKRRPKYKTEEGRDARV